MAGCGAVCYEVDPESVQTEEKLVYAGAGRGSYQQVSSMEMVGRGRGDFEKEKVVVSSGMRLRAGAVGGSVCLGIVCIFLLIGFLNNWWQTPMQAPIRAPIVAPAPAPEVTHNVDQYYYHVKDVKVDQTIPIHDPAPPRKVITHKVMVHTHAYDCDAGSEDWQHTWSTQHARYCCYLRQIGCKTKVEYRPHYHTITKTKPVTVKVPVPVPAPPPRVITHVQNVPIHDAPQIIKVPTPGAPHIVPKYVHQKHYVPVPEPSPPQYHSVPVPVKVTDPGKIIKVPEPMPPQTIVKNKVIYKTKHVQVQHIYDCAAGYSNWLSGWSSDKKSWCCAHEQKGCPGSHSGHLSKTVVTGVTTHEGPTYYHHTHSYSTGDLTGATHSYSTGDLTGAAHSYSTGGLTSAGFSSGDSTGSLGGLSGASGSFSTGDLGDVGGSYGTSASFADDRGLKDEDESEPKARRLQMIVGQTHGGIIGGSAGTVVHHYVDGSSAGGIVGGDIGTAGTVVHHYVDGSSAGGIVGGDIGTGGTVVHHYVDGSSAGGIVGGDIGTGGTVVHHYVDGSSAGGIVGGDIGTGGTVVHHYVDGSSGSGIVGGGHYVGSSIGGVIPATHYVGGASSVGGIIHGGVQDHVHVTHYTVPAPVPQPVTPQVKVKQVVQNHYGTVYRKVPVNHYVHVKTPEQPPIVHTVKVMTPAKTYSCDGLGDQPDPSWSEKHTRWCCYKYGSFCPKTVVDKNTYHTVVKTQPLRVPVPEPMPTHAPIVKTIHHTYHVPSPPQYVHVPVPGPTVVKPVVVPESVPVPVPQPPKVINVKKPYTVHVPGPNHYVHVPVPSPPHIVTKYHTKWNTVVDHGDSTSYYDCDKGADDDWHSLWSHAKQRWCCSHKFVGCPGSVSTGLDSLGSTLAGDSLASSFGSDYGSLGSSSLTLGASDSDLSASTLSSGALSSSDFSSDLSGSTLSSGALSSSGFSSGLSTLGDDTLPLKK